METLHERVRIQWVVGTAIGGVVLAGVVFLLGSVESWFPQTLAAAGVLVVVLGLGVGHASALYRDWRFELQDDALYLERGVVTRVETAVPYVRVQHVDTQRTPLDRALGLSRVVVYTAGSRGADVTVPGLVPERARELRNKLRELAVAAEPEDAV
ncbi:PH domain-containing protein [Haloarchaeobius sp. DFWS5]|uniref:PH domain-containing protein n=1 Tax=Haloarchaeobius sp. DFWS5 TaxID=3446114 RepID=UPI003EB9E347